VVLLRFHTIFFSICVYFVVRLPWCGVSRLLVEFLCVPMNTSSRHVKEVTSRVLSSNRKVIDFNFVIISLVRNISISVNSISIQFVTCSSSQNIQFGTEREHSITRTGESQQPAVG
jgi:hypothetical protein